MNALTIHTLPHRLRRPILIAAFSGWNDAAESATTAARYLASTFHAEKFAEIDPEEKVQADLTDLDEATRQLEQNLADLSQNAKIKSYVPKLESRATEEVEQATPGASNLPPASQLVDEIEQFMRQQRPE